MCPAAQFILVYALAHSLTCSLTPFLLLQQTLAYLTAGGALRMVVGGRYGLGSKDFTPAMAKAVFDNLLADKPRDRFTVGITGMC